MDYSTLEVEDKPAMRYGDGTKTVVALKDKKWDDAEKEAARRSFCIYRSFYAVFGVMSLGLGMAFFFAYVALGRSYPLEIGSNVPSVGALSSMYNSFYVDAWAEIAFGLILLVSVVPVVWEANLKWVVQDRIFMPRIFYTTVSEFMLYFGLWNLLLQTDIFPLSLVAGLAIAKGVFTYAQ